MNARSEIERADIAIPDPDGCKFLIRKFPSEMKIETCRTEMRFRCIISSFKSYIGIDCRGDPEIAELLEVRASELEGWSEIFVRSGIPCYEGRRDVLDGCAK